MRRYFGFFLVSGFCGLVYETVWIRLSMAQFGVTAPAMSIVVSIFMAGLALGAWLVARGRGRLDRLDAAGALRAYALAELGIGLLGLLVPPLLRTGGSVLGAALEGHGRIAWYLAALGWQALVVLPATAAMGATIPLGMHAIGKARLEGSGTSFSYLYLANVLGAIAGALLPAFVLIEVLGFSTTLRIALVLNLGIAGIAWAASRKAQTREGTAAATEPALTEPSSDRVIVVLLFLTGLSSLGMEVVWTRQFVPFVGTVVYSFAAILAVYLGATFAGSVLYRRSRTKGDPLAGATWAGVALLSTLPLVLTDRHLIGSGLYMEDYTLHLASVARVALGIAPFSAALGFLTPQLVDRWSGGRSDRAGIAYAVNTVGCILGPLLAGFVLLPLLSERWALALLCLPFVLASLFLSLRGAGRGLAWSAVGAAAVAAIVLGSRSFMDAFPEGNVQRDETATTVAVGSGMHKQLLVNGVGMTILTPATKMMAHLPLAMLDHPPRRALAICFGMGTTFRSLLSWNIEATAVELVPGVPRLFPYFHRDARAVLANPKGKVLIDDGRRFLETTDQKFDVIIFDPPPPVSAASSSLLYSKELYALVKQRLAPGGILQQWIPSSEPITVISMLRSITEAFPHVIGFHEPGMGIHLLASMQPIAVPTAAQLAARMPPAAAADLVEWGPQHSAATQFQDVLARPMNLTEPLTSHPGVPALTDDEPVNEYYFLRELVAELGG